MQLLGCFLAIHVRKQAPTSSQFVYQDYISIKATELKKQHYGVGAGVHGGGKKGDCQDSNMKLSLANDCCSLLIDNRNKRETSTNSQKFIRQLLERPRAMG